LIFLTGYGFVDKAASNWGSLQKATKRSLKKVSDDCIIPRRPKPELLRISLVESSPNKEVEIVRYFESQSSKDLQGSDY
jgi:hypothetical protein